MSETIPEARELAESIIGATEGCGCDECLEKATKLATDALLARDERAAKIVDEIGGLMGRTPEEAASAIRDRSKT